MKKLFTLIIALMAVVILNAQTDVWDGTHVEWTHGSGTEADPYLIESAENLAHLAYLVNNGLGAGSGHVVGTGKYYKMTVDIDLNGSESFQWTPIGYWNNGADYFSFGGNFDGDNHTIANLYISSDANRVGLFGYADGTSISNFGIIGNGLVSGGAYAGGIVGYCDGVAEINNCYNTDSISSSSTSGGIAGWCNGNISNCNNTGTVTSFYSSGGIAGRCNGNISNCYNTGSVSSIYYTDGTSSGGIVGCGNGDIEISNCYNTGGVSSTPYGNSGGIVGYGKVNLNISNSYNVGTISSGRYKGGIVGIKYNSGVVSNSYYLNTCGGDNQNGGEPKTEVFMKDMEFVTLLNDGSLTYKMDETPNINQGYPIFSEFCLEITPATDITNTGAILHASYTNGGYTIISQGFQYRKQSETDYTTASCTAGVSPFSYTLNNLESGMTYFYRAFVEADEGTAFTAEEQFTTTIPGVFTITAISYGLGTIDPSGTIEVLEGENQTFTFTPQPGNSLDSLLVNGVNVGDVGTYTFNHVTENHLIEAYFTNIVTPDNEPWDGFTINTPPNEGNTYYIYSPTQLAWVAQQVNNGINDFSGKLVKVMTDLDLGGALPNPSTWNPIGNYTNHFCGDFDGNNQIISNLYYNNQGNDYIGLFGYAGQTMSNIIMKNVNISGKDHVGAICGYNYFGTLNNCRAEGHVSGYNNVGGLCGSTNENITYDCSMVGEITGNGYVGGIAGGIYQSVYDNTSNRNYVSANVTGNNYVGGFAGKISVSGTGNTLMSFSGNVVFGSVLGNIAGGFAGQTYGSGGYGTLNFESNYTNVSVKGTSIAGGFIGERTAGGVANINGCYSAGSVSENGRAFIGSGSANCTNCFVDKQIAGVDGFPSGVSSKKTSEMTSGTSFGLPGNDWVYTSGLYPQLSYFANNEDEEIRKASLLSVAPAFLQNEEVSSEVHSDFILSTQNGVRWSSSDPSIIGINGSNANVSPNIVAQTVTLTASLDNFSKKIDITVAGADTILIYNAEELRMIADQCNSGATYEGKYVKLMSNIEFPANVPNNMVAIGSYSDDKPFMGTFDGNGKTIKNVYLDMPNDENQALFSYTKNANLYEVGLVDFTVSGRYNVAGIVAYADNTYIRDSYIRGGTLFALSYAGGMVGHLMNYSTVCGCYNACDVSANNYVGGIVGLVENSTVRNSYVVAKVSGLESATGAIIGRAEYVLSYNNYFSFEETGQTEAIGENIYKSGDKPGGGMNSADMKKASFVTTMNEGLQEAVYMKDYTNPVNEGFPIIKWQPNTNDPCDAPVNLIVNQVSAEWVELSWQGAANQYEVRYGLGSSYSNNITTSSNSLRITGLQQLSTYKWKIKSICTENQSDFVEGQQFTTTGIGLDENMASLGIKIMPNPVKEYLMIDISDASVQISDIQIFDIMGRIQFEKHLTDEITRLDTGKLSSGLYFIKVNCEDGNSCVMKIVRK